jgi:hypothetical protein
MMKTEALMTFDCRPATPSRDGRLERSVPSKHANKAFRAGLPGPETSQTALSDRAQSLHPHLWKLSFTTSETRIAISLLRGINLEAVTMKAAHPTIRRPTTSHDHKNNVSAASTSLSLRETITCM